MPAPGRAWRLPDASPRASPRAPSGSGLAARPRGACPRAASPAPRSGSPGAAGCDRAGRRSRPAPARRLSRPPPGCRSGSRPSPSRRRHGTSRTASRGSAGPSPRRSGPARRGRDARRRHRRAGRQDCRDQHGRRGERLPCPPMRLHTPFLFANRSPSRLKVVQQELNRGSRTGGRSRLLEPRSRGGIWNPVSCFVILFQGRAGPEDTGATIKVEAR